MADLKFLLEYFQETIKELVQKKENNAAVASIQESTNDTNTGLLTTVITTKVPQQASVVPHKEMTIPDSCSSDDHASGHEVPSVPDQTKDVIITYIFYLYLSLQFVCKRLI